MAVKTTLEQLESVQAAIEKIETEAQSYSIKDRELARANLKDLYAREKVLLARYNREQRGGGIRVRGAVV